MDQRQQDLVHQALFSDVRFLSKTGFSSQCELVVVADDCMLPLSWIHTLQGQGKMIVGIFVNILLVCFLNRLSLFFFFDSHDIEKITVYRYTDHIKFAASFVLFYCR